MPIMNRVERATQNAEGMDHGSKRGSVSDKRACACNEATSVDASMRMTSCRAHEQRLGMIDVGLNDAQHLVVDDVGVTQLEQFITFCFERSHAQAPLALPQRVELAATFGVSRLLMNTIFVFFDERVGVCDLVMARESRQLAPHRMHRSLRESKPRGTLLALCDTVAANAHATDE